MVHRWCTGRTDKAPGESVVVFLVAVDVDDDDDGDDVAGDAGDPMRPRGPLKTPLVPVVGRAEVVVLAVEEAQSRTKVLVEQEWNSAAVCHVSAAVVSLDYPLGQVTGSSERPAAARLSTS